MAKQVGKSLDLSQADSSLVLPLVGSGMLGKSHDLSRLQFLMWKIPSKRVSVKVGRDHICDQTGLCLAASN